MATKTLCALLAAGAVVLGWAGRVAAQDAGPESGVVLIELPEGQGRGAGIVLAVRQAENQNEVLILTAHHVLETLKKQEHDVPVRFYGSPTSFRAEIIDKWIDEDEDMEVIRVRDNNVPRSIQPLRLGNADSVSQHSPVTAIGHRIGGRNEEWLSDDGKVVQPVGRRITFSRITADKGFSGGPLLNSKGDVVGIVTEVNTTGGSATR